MRTAIVYYSLEGNTELIANILAELIGGDIIKLKPQKELQGKGFKKYFWGGMHAVFNEKPKLNNDFSDISNYDTIMIGTPIWAGTVTPPVNTFLSEAQLKNKKIILFACSSGGDVSKCFDKMRSKLDGNEIKGIIDFIDPKKSDISIVRKKAEDFAASIR